jgi:DNA-binding MarR family transcriptional regulator
MTPAIDMPARRRARSPLTAPQALAIEAPADADAALHVDLERHVPAAIAWIANKLAHGASQAYRAAFDIGIETWRILMLLAVEGSTSAQRVGRVTGMDKASVSRAFRRMAERELITLRQDAADVRLRIATLTARGRRLHDRMLGIALERERAFVAVLSPPERETLIALLQRLHANLPQVERATAEHLARHFPKAKRRALADEAEASTAPRPLREARR